MNLTIIQIILDGMPFLPFQIAEFENLSVDWNLILVHGAAANAGSTRWCRQQPPRLSKDGSTEFLNSLSGHKRIRVIQKQWWPGGKDQMFSEAIATITKSCVLFMPDVDEFFTSSQIENIVSLFRDNRGAMRAYFFCRYFLGRSIVATSENGYGNRQGEFLRAFRFSPRAFTFIHEPPILDNNKGHFISREDTRKFGIVFDHFAYTFKHQLQFKERFYNYHNATYQWSKLQLNAQWPVTDLKKWLPWVGDNASADLFSNVYPGEVNPTDKFV